MAIIKQYHKDTDTTYVYESTSYWDPVKKQSRSKRRVIGKVDPITGDIVPTGKRGGNRRSRTGDSKKLSAVGGDNGDQTSSLKKRLAECLKENEQMKKELRKLRSENSRMAATMKKINEMSGM